MRHSCLAAAAPSTPIRPLHRARLSAIRAARSTLDRSRRARPNSADFRGFRSGPPTGSTSRRSITCRSRLSVSASSATLRYESRPTSTSRPRLSGTGASRRTRRRRCRCSSARRGQSGTCSTRSSIDATNPFNPFGVTLRPTIRGRRRNDGNYAFIGRRLMEGWPAPVQADGQHDLRRGDARREIRLSSHDWYWDVNGRLRPATRPSRPCSATSTPRKLAQALGPDRRLHRALRAVQHLRR